MRECPKPFDRAAVSTARRQHKSKRNHTPGSRLPSRYYQSPQGGKYDGLKPGSLDAETRQLLGLGVNCQPSSSSSSSSCIGIRLEKMSDLFVLVQELDPPPWLHRMRELGYPPGYISKLFLLLCSSSSSYQRQLCS